MKQKGIVLIIVLFCSVLSIGLKPVDGSKKSKAYSGGHFETILPDIYLFKDICNVFVLRSGSSALLIDAGSGKISDYLKEIGIDKIEWVLHTHYHRDQCIGSPKLRKSGAQIAIGKSEAPLLNRAEATAPFKIPDSFLLNGEFPNWGRRMSPFQSPGIDRELVNGEEFNWNQYKITVINTPGHTKGSISYLVEADGKRLCFTGDLIMKGGHIRDLYSMQWVYLQNPGINASIASLQIINELKPDILLPSHNGIIDDPPNEIKLLDNRLKRVKESFTKKRAGRWNWSGFVQVSEHVIQDCGSTSQIIISNSGEALLFDCGKEFSRERLQEAKTKFGITRIAVIIPSHWHYDHVDGITAIAEAEGAKTWAWEGLAEYLEHPENFPTTCWTGKRIKVDRILKEGEEFEWGGNSFKVYHHPVHTEQQMGLYANVDGLGLYMIADGIGYSKKGNIRCSIHCYNGISLVSGMIKTAQSLYDANPYICLPAHSNVFAVAANDKQEFLDWSIKTTDAIRSLLTPPHQELGYDPYWASFYPARVHIQPGGEIEISLRLKNYSGKIISGKCRLKGYGDIIFKKAIVQYILNPGEIKDFPVIVKSKKTAGKGIHIVTADIEYGNNVFAELPQAYVQIDE
ncbi:hypothetical protein MNBD_BACTEROID01-2281 [hydrothermal vent metagenome]|uniref:Metallo-beta-lactamase domain-containing protein n=1 Tax=hydrothermal vent metagenome TaxID=652676 RepID=A0A3B0TLX2_9ZZZZ